MSRRLIRLPLVLLLGLLLVAPAAVWAGPVSWKEVTPTAEGRQWWDEGSLRINRAGNLTVLSRFESAPEAGTPAAATNAEAAAPVSAATSTGSSADPAAPPSPAPAGSLSPSAGALGTASRRSAPTISRLYVMELDCDQSLYRDTSINGLPQFGASWQPTGSDDLTAEVLRQACAAEAA